VLRSARARLMFTEECLHQSGGALPVSTHQLEPLAKRMLRSGFPQTQIADGTDAGEEIVEVICYPHCNRTKNFLSSSAPKLSLDSFPDVLRTFFSRLLAHREGKPLVSNTAAVNYSEWGQTLSTLGHRTK